ncbi:MAG: Eco57I restriction-modification methylase domain-containing protein [Anaerolineae bacterium]|nr:Eco57I restriction-modification methylase domain-containing protein [Anaerolineae bacterium]
MSDSESRKQQLQALVAQYVRDRDQYVRLTSTYNETQLRADYLDPLLEILGWDVKNERGLPQYRREVILEDTVEVEDDEAELTRKKPDYALCLDTERKLFVEAKKPRVRIEQDRQAAFQVRRYGWNARLPISVLSNFDKLIIYDCTPRPDHNDDPGVGRLTVYDHTEYVTKFDELYERLSRDAVYSGRFDVLFPMDTERTGTEAFDDYFLDQIESWREALSRSLAERNPRLSEAELNFLVQRLINRIIFLRICEDRELEQYKTLYEVTSYDELKRLFQDADRRYNSGLFDFVEDGLSLNVDLDGDVLVDIFKELYYPQSPYAFSVVEANVLGEIYELFLGREVRLIPPHVEVVEKPEVVASGGVVPTPPFIVENIVARTIAPQIDGKSPVELTDYRVADICCGSGTFLLGASDYLFNHYLEWYLNDGADNHADKLYQGRQGIWYLSLDEKQRILLNHIFGVDIDIQAVEVARFSLLLKLLENESNAAVQAYTERHHRGALPKLDGNIQHGNSLVDLGYFDFDEDAGASETLIAQINPFDWTERFGAIMRAGGFDAVVGNPPYIRIQNMVKYSEQEVRYYQWTESPYTTARADNFDKYALFIEKALGLLKPDGMLGYVVPHKFFTIRSGKALRELLSVGKHLAEITHFGVLQVFGKARSTYTCILIVSKAEQERFTVEHVADLAQWRLGQARQITEHLADSIGEAPWEFLSPEATALFDRLRHENPTVLSDVARIFVGVQTSADKIYIFEPKSETVDTVTFDDIDGVTWTIEKSILRPALMDVQLPAFSRPQANTYIIFPYNVGERSATLYSPDEMLSQFPLCWEYLQSHESKLRSRSLQDAEKWYGYGRTQSLTRFNGEAKLIWPVLSLEPRYAYDDQDILFTGGGNGPYYGLRPLPDTALSIFYLQAILSHPVFEAMVKSIASPFRGGYKSHGKQFVQSLPVRQIDFNDPDETAAHDNIVTAVQQLIQATEGLKTASLPQQQQTLRTQSRILKQRIDRLIEGLYRIDGADLLTIPELHDDE